MPLGPTALALILPNGVARHVGLLVAKPNLVAGTYVEVADTEYVRVAHAAWVDSAVDGVAVRRNDGAIVFPAIVDDDTQITYWAIFTAAIAGNILAAGPLLNIAGKPQPQLISTNDVPRFNSGELKLLSEEP